MTSTPSRKDGFRSTYLQISGLLSKFLLDNVGVLVLQKFEELWGVSFQCGEDYLRITHTDCVDPKALLDRLKKIWHQHSLQRCYELSCQASCAVYPHSTVLPVVHAGIVCLFSSEIITKAGLKDLSVARDGKVVLVGSVTSVSEAYRCIEQLFEQHIPSASANRSPLSPVSITSGYTQSPSPRTTTSGRSSAVYDSNGVSAGGLDNFSAGRLNSLDRTPRKYYGSPMKQFNYRSYNNTPRKRPKLFFMVQCTDAPRLIGTRGNTKKRLEENTGCQIILHTESRQDGVFPVEIVGLSDDACMSARKYIETFIQNEGFPEDYRKPSTRIKQMLQLSPRKRVGSTPLKESNLVAAISEAALA